MNNKSKKLQEKTQTLNDTSKEFATLTEQLREQNKNLNDASSWDLRKFYTKIKNIVSTAFNYLKNIFNFMKKTAKTPNVAPEVNTAATSDVIPKPIKTSSRAELNQKTAEMNKKVTEFVNKAAEINAMYKAKASTNSNSWISKITNKFGF